MTTQNLYSELLIDYIWTDISNKTYTRDGGASISCGRSQEGQRVDPANCQLVLNNRDGRFSPRLPTSPYYSKIGRNSKIRLSSANPTTVSDLFTRSTSNGWGTSTSGQAWTNVGGSASDRSVNGTQGVITLPTSITTNRIQYVGSSLTDMDIVATVIPTQVSVNGNLHAFAQVRYNTGSGARYEGRVTFNTVNGINVSIRDGSGQLAAPVATGLTYAANDILKMRVRVVRDVIFIRVWTLTQIEPALWHLTYRVPSGVLTSGVATLGWVADSGNTNSTPTVKYDDVVVTDLTKIRMVGEVANWPARWDVKGKDIYTPVEVNGVLRRLGQGASALKSTMYRIYTSPTRIHPIAYWACEDGEKSTRVASSIGKSAMRVYGAAPAYGAYSDFLCSDAVLTLGATRLVGPVPAHTNTGTEVMRALIYIGTAVSGADKQIMSFRTNGTANLWILWLGSSGGLTLKVYNDDDQLIHTSSSWLFGLNGQQAELRLQGIQNGSDVNYEVGVRYLSDNTSSVSSGTVTSRTIGTIQHCTITWDKDIPDLSVGHVVVANDTTVFEDSSGSFTGSITAWQGEPAGERIERLCTEEGIQFAGFGDLSNTELLGAQLPETLIELLQSAADSDGGILYETRYELGLSYRTRTSIYNQTSMLDLNYATKQISPPFEPDEDDDSLRNDVTVERTGGSSARVFLASGPLSVMGPPFGVGIYDEQITLSLYRDDQCDDQAGWRVHLGTWNEARYPKVTINLTRQSSIAATVANVKFGDRITVSNPPTWLPPDLIDLIVQGADERIGGVDWEITLNCTPGGPWRVGVVEDPILGRLDTAGSQINTSATNATGQGTSSTPDYIVVSDAEAAGFSVGNLIQLYTSGGSIKESTTFTITAKNSAFGFTNIVFTPNAQALTVTGDVVRRVDQTSLSVATTSGPIWVTGSSAPTFPFDITCEGEIMTVTAISGSSSPQTFTVTRGVNGMNARRGHMAGAALSLTYPLIVAL